ncbi:MAG: 4-(cytidine 5'-diphospho)-2-C-methyl-D-erythritol kinase [Candidatus Latescibacteria bacterium]|nr:4-(cytidine 5'-diphospho)-2-C-methyl-D-erythritol kinase [Candidatus Latescibacterota bacterium]
MTIHSYAKINLGLRVLRKRPDGYHDIETVMQTVDLTDTLTVSPQASGTTVTCDDPAVPTDERNLAYRAAELIRSRVGTESGVRVDIQKRIPVAAGLAGGSGNGAVTLIALDRLWDAGLSFDDLLAMADRLGSDVPFCLRGGMAIGRGRGEVVEFLDTACPFAFVLVTPPCAVSTAWAYQQVKIELTNFSSIVNLIISSLHEGDLDRLVVHLRNDLESPVLAHLPVVGRVKQTLIDCGAAGAAMSGSGPTVFGVVPDRLAASRVADRVRQVETTWRVWVAMPVSAREIAERSGR